MSFKKGDLVSLRGGPSGVIIEVIGRDHPENPKNNLKPVDAKWEYVVECGWLRVYIENNITLQPEYLFDKIQNVNQSFLSRHA